MNTPIVEVKGLAKWYKMGHGKVDALRHVDLTIYKGELVALMGPSGSGKSTLLHLLGCLDTPSEGQYLLNAQDVSHLSDLELSSLRASRIGFVFQSFNLIQQLTVFENVQVPFLYQPHQEAETREKILWAIDRVGLSHRLHHLPSELSGGETQRVAIARALAIDPLLILADEPTGNLDSRTGQTILDMFQDLNEKGVTILIVTHDESVGAYCQRVIRMRDGQIVSEEKNRIQQKVST